MANALTQLLFWVWVVILAPVLCWGAAFAIDRTDAVLWLLVVALPALLALAAAAVTRQPGPMYLVAVVCAVGASGFILSALGSIR